jgi:hypothetical protein
MSQIHSYQIEKLKTNFNNLITIKKEIAKVKLILADTLNQLKSVYNDLIRTNTKKIFLFCLDSFYFQYKTFVLEMEHIDKTRTLVNNRMYCDYYKLYNLICAYIKENKSEISLSDLELKTYPAYKDLDPFLEYKIEDIRALHDNILHIIDTLYLQTQTKSDDIVSYSDKRHIGFSISNFLNTLEYENRVLKEQISLYVNYMSFFHISQKKQLNRLLVKIQEFNKEVEENIHINSMFSIEDITSEKRLDSFIIHDENVRIESILQDSEFIMENSDSLIRKLGVMVNGGNEGNGENANPMESEPISLDSVNIVAEFEDVNTTTESSQDPTPP